MKGSKVVVILLALGVGFSVPARTETVAYRGATIHPVSGPPLENAVLVVEDGIIKAIDENEPIPAGAEVVDLSGKRIYPGFVHPASTLGLIEIRSVRGTRDTREVGNVNSDLRAEVAFNSDSMLLPVAVSGGILTAHVVLRGGVFSGTSAVMRLDGWTWEDMTLKAPVGMHLNYPEFVPRQGRFREKSEEELKEEREKALKTIRETLQDARAYAKARRAAADGKAKAVATNPRLEALLPVLDGTLPLFIRAVEKTQIESALDWAKEEELTNLVLVTGPDSQYLAERLAEEKIPVILNDVLSLPRRSWEPYDSAYAAAAKLHQAGVKFCIGDGFGASNARNLPFEAAMAAAFGLPKDAALKSVTLWPAEILGVADRLGSLEPGKLATFLVTDGDPLEIRTRIEAAWIEGRRMDPSRDRQKRLYERYRSRPRPASGPAGRP